MIIMTLVFILIKPRAIDMHNYNQCGRLNKFNIYFRPGMEYPVFEGTFTMNGEMYHIKTISNYKLSKRQDDAELTNPDNAHMVIYRDSDTTLVPPQGSKDDDGHSGECGFDRLAFNNGNQFQHPVLRSSHPASGELGIYTPSFDITHSLTKRQDTSGCPTSTLSKNSFLLL